jgi:hypothetical protein
VYKVPFLCYGGTMDTKTMIESAKGLPDAALLDEYLTYMDLVRRDGGWLSANELHKAAANVARDEILRRMATSDV